MTRRLSNVLVVLAVFALLFVAGTTARADEATGKIKSVSADKDQFVVTDKDGKDWTFTMSDTGKIRLNDKDVKLNELKTGDEVEVTYTKLGDKLQATAIRCKRADK